MTIEEFYTLINGDLAGARGRLRDDERILKYVRFFLEDPTYGTLVEALAAGNAEEAFRAAHTMKGLAANLSFSALEAAASDLTEALRNTAEPASNVNELLAAVTDQYNLIVANCPQ